MFKRLAAALLLRKVVTELHALTLAVSAQNALLARLVDHLAPAAPDVPRETLREDTGLSHLDPVEAQLAQAFIARSVNDTGHTPDDEEVLIYLADEKTTDLHKRLIEREAELERLQEVRR